MEKLIRPCFFVTFYDTILLKSVTMTILVPDGVPPMNLYNALLKRYKSQFVDNRYGWLTSKGRELTSTEAAEFALEKNLLDKRVTHLSVTDTTGEWTI